MRRYLAGLAAITITIGTLVTAQSAGAFERYRAEGYDVTTFEPYERTSSPSWSPTWEPTWTPEPQMPEPTPTYSEPTYQAYPESGGCLSGEQVASYALGAGFPAEVVPTMVQIADRESGFCAGAINVVSGACGLWQIYPAQPGCTDPAANAAMAWDKYSQDVDPGPGYTPAGLSPWAMTAP